MSLPDTFTESLTIQNGAAPDRVCGPDGAAAGVRFDVYRNNVAVSLTEALRTSFPAVEKLVGASTFAGIARAFIASHPPDSPVMTFYGARFARWMAGFAPLADWPYLPEVATIEYARIGAYHARDANPFDPDTLRAMPEDVMAGLRLAPHPSVRLVETAYPALSIWAQNMDEPALRNAPAGTVLVSRPVWHVQMMPAPQGTGETLAALARGLPLGTALSEEADVGAILACLFSAQALILEEH